MKILNNFNYKIQQIVKNICQKLIDKFKTFLQYLHDIS